MATPTVSTSDKTPPVSFDYEPLKKLTKDILTVTKTLSAHEVRFLVDNYYLCRKGQDG